MTRLTEINFVSCCKVLKIENVPDLKNKLISFIQFEIIGDDDGLELAADEDLLGGGIIDSIGMMRLISFIESESETSVPFEDITIENFENVESITKYLEDREIVF